MATVAYIPGYTSLLCGLNDTFTLKVCVIGFELGMIAETFPISFILREGM